MISTIPFKVLNIDNEGFHLLIKLRINRKIAKLIIDTGASKTVLDTNRIKKYVGKQKFDVHSKLSSGLGTNTMQSHTTILKKMKIGDIVINDYETVLLDLSNVNKSYEQVGLKPVEGVLGGDILVEYKAIIDYSQKVLKLHYSKPKK